MFIKNARLLVMILIAGGVYSTSEAIVIKHINGDIIFLPDYEFGVTTKRQFIDSIIKARPELSRASLKVLVKGQGVISDTDEVLEFGGTMNTMGIIVIP